ncbi:GNAT family N-acetyltransferase [Deinococcus altitudinis]|uniref:GNAT family N-acetyltransferase n=1 Tax=Deinococcus altitudinis TaxID=468914 RepID=UPI0038929E3F
MTMTIRPYRTEDETACLNVFMSNTPDFFTVEEQQEFNDFLCTMTDPYFVLEEAGRIVACGGVFIRRDGQTAGLAWGMVNRSQHRQGYGRALLDVRLAWLGQHAPAVNTVTIDTSQHSAPFFTRMGFEILEVKRDFYATGLDRYDMRLALSAVSARH